MDVPRIETGAAVAGADRAAPVRERKVAVPAVPAIKKPTPSVDQEIIKQTHQAIAARLEQYLRESGRDLEIRVDAAANATVITVRRADTGEVIRQFPNEEALSLMRRLNEQHGTFIDLFA